MLTDVEGPVKAWAAATLGLRVFFGKPQSDTSALTGPLVVLSRIGGGPEQHVPVDQPRLSFACYGRTKAEAATTAAAVVEALWSLQAGTMLGSLRALGASGIFGPLWQPEVVGGAEHPRYIVDATVSVIGTN